MAAGQRGRPKGSTGAKNSKKRVNTYKLATPAAKQALKLKKERAERVKELREGQSPEDIKGYAEGAPGAKKGDYTPEGILNSRTRGGTLEYEVLWKGYRADDSTWEPVTNLQHANELIDEFYEAFPTKPGAPGAQPSRRGRKPGQTKASQAAKA